MPSLEIFIKMLVTLVGGLAVAVPIAHLAIPIVVGSTCSQKNSSPGWACRKESDVVSARPIVFAKSWDYALFAKVAGILQSSPA